VVWNACAILFFILCNAWQSILCASQFSVRQNAIVSAADHVQIVPSLPFATLLLRSPLFLSQFDFPSVSHCVSFIFVLFLQHPCVGFQMGSYPPPLCVLVDSLERIFRVCWDGWTEREGQQAPYSATWLGPSASLRYCIFCGYCCCCLLQCWTARQLALGL
jgi:hypothetical protein